MRGAARVGGRSWKLPQDVPERENPFDLDAFEMLSPIGDLPVAPVLEPINDEWSISNFNEPVDEKDCAKYPASPYCENEWIDPFGSPFGFSPDIKSNGCETCVYVYPIIMWMKLQPTIICKRDPNCKEDNPTPPSSRSKAPPPYNENVSSSSRKSPACAARESAFNRIVNEYNAREKMREKAAYYNISRSNPQNIEIRPFSSSFINQLGDKITYTGETVWTYEGIWYSKGSYIPDPEGISPTLIYDPDAGETQTAVGIPATGGFRYMTWEPAPCPDIPPILPPPPLPPISEGQGGNGKGKNRGKGKDMCCNDCKDSKDNTDKLLKEIKEIKKALGSGKLEKALNAAVGIGDDSITAIVNLIAKRIGTSSYPIEVPESLLQGTGDRAKKLESNAEFLHWLTYQFDGLVGQFPIDVEVKDIDPLKEGDQKKIIQLPNIAEAIAEIYGLVIKSSVNQEVELNMLLRLAAEAIATKNAAVVTQDYARANALFLGYKANFKPRELQYNFDFTNANLDPKSKEPIVLEKLLRTVKGYVQGWQLEDKETVVGFLQKLMFSAGIIKAVFFRGKGQQKELQREINSMANDEKAQEAKFEAFIKEINDPNSRFNKESQDKPGIKDETPPDSKRAK